MIEVGLIGPGRVGRTLVGSLAKPAFRLGPVLARTRTSAVKAVREMEDGSAARELKDLAGSQLILVTVPEPALPEVAEQLAVTRFPLAGKVVLHTSRVYDSSQLAGAREQGAAVGSLQPIFSFERPVASLAGVHCAVEGDPAATGLARKMIRSWNGEFQLVSREQKARLGVAASISSDFFAAILDMAVQQLMFAGFLRKRAVDALSKMIEVTFNDYRRTGKNSRAGPLLQGNADMVRSYLAALADQDPGRADAYRRMALQTLELMTKNDDRFSFLQQKVGAGGRALPATAGGSQ